MMITNHINTARHASLRNPARRPLTQAVTLAALMIGQAALAQAQAPAGARSGALEEVVVTSRRMTESLQSTPISVVAVSGDDLQELGVTGLGQLDAFIPNVTAGTAMANSGWANFSIRGIGGGHGWIYQESGVGVYIDDIYYPRANGALLDVIDVEQIEVLRGPQGTLFGRNTSGGAIRYVTAKPDSEFGGKFIGAVGSYDRRDVTGIVNIPLTEQLSSRFTFSSKSRDGFVKRLNDGIKTGDSDVTAARAQLRWQDEKWDVNLAMDTLETENNGVARVIPMRRPTDVFPFLLGDPSYTDSVTGRRHTVEGGTLPDRNELESFGVTLTAEREINEQLTFKSLTGYRDNENSSYSDWDLSSAELWSSDLELEFSNWSQEFQLSGQAFSDRLKYVVGAYYMKEEATMYNIRKAPIFPGPSLEYIDLETTTTALFGQGTFDVTDRLSFTLGLRWSRDEKDVYSTVPPLAGENSDSWSSVTPRFGIEYQATDDLMVYVSAAKGFKSGGMNNNPNPLLPNNGIIPYDPEELWTYEAGFRSEFFDNRVRFNATYFHTTYQDIQTTAPRISGTEVVTVTENAAEATLKGIEFELTAAITDRLTVHASGGWIDSQYDELGNIIAIRKDTPFQRTPEYSYTIGAAYQQPLQNGALVDFNIDYGWKDKQFNTDSADSGFYLPSYGVLNARLAYTEPKERWTLALVGTNLLDEYYQVGGFHGNPNERFFGFEQADLGRPREVRVELTVNF